MSIEHARTYLRKLRMPRAERDAAGAERRTGEPRRRQRDNPMSAERRAAAIAAERWRARGYGAGGR